MTLHVLVKEHIRDAKQSKCNSCSCVDVLLYMLLHVEEIEARIERHEVLRHHKQLVIELDDTLQL